MSCAGPVEHWLGSFHDVLRSTLKESLLATVQWTSSFLAGTQSTDGVGTKSQFVCYLQQLCLKENKVNNLLLLLAAEIELANQLRSSIKDLEQSGYKATLESLLQCISTGLQHCIGVLKESHDVSEIAVSHGMLQTQPLKESSASPLSKNWPNVEGMGMNFIRFTNRIKSLILVLNQYQQMAQNLIEGNLSLPTNAHCIEYIFDANDSGLHLHLGSYELEYGFEMQSATKRLVITPYTEQYFSHLMAAVSNRNFNLCLGKEVIVS